MDSFREQEARRNEVNNQAWAQTPMLIGLFVCLAFPPLFLIPIAYVCYKASDL